MSHLIAGRSGVPSRLLVVLHGWDARPADVAPLARGLDPAGRFLAVAPQGPVDVGVDRFAWFERDDEGAIVAASFRAGLDDLDDLIDSFVFERGLDSRGTVVAGFSQGGAAAITLARRPRPSSSPERARPAAVACLSGFLAQSDDPALALDGDGADEVPVLVQHGVDDEVVPALLGRAVARLCGRSGAPVTHQELDMGHEATEESLAAAAHWLNEVSAGGRVQARG